MMMNRKKTTRTILTAIAIGGLLLATQRQGVAQTDQRISVASRTVLPSTSQGLDAMNAAARDGKYLFLFFWKNDDAQSRTMRGVFQSAMSKWADSSNSIDVQVTDPNERPLVKKFGLSRAPMPMVLALAPNGAVTKGFPVKFSENQLREGFVSPGTAGCLKALQDQKLVLLCIQNEQIPSAQVAMTAAQSFKADARYAKTTEIVTLNPQDPSEAGFLQDLKVDPRTSQAVTVVLAPPGNPVASFVGDVTKDQIIAKVTSAQSSCCPGGTCCPPK